MLIGKAEPLGAPGAGVNLGLPIAGIVVLIIASAINGFLTAPIKAGIDSLLYVDQRMRKENLAYELQQAAAQVRRG